MNIDWNLIFGNDTWRINTIRRVETALSYLIISGLGLHILWLIRPAEIDPMHRYVWCVFCGLLGLSFRAWQWRFDIEPTDPRKDGNNVPPPLPAYLIDYPFIVIINSLVIYIILSTLGKDLNFITSDKNLNFYIPAIPLGVYFGSMVKLINFKFFQ